MNKLAPAQQAKVASVLPPAQGILQRKCTCGNQTITGGECTECVKKKNSLQLKLAIGASNDPLEREADRVADQVITMSTNSDIGQAAPHIQRLTGQSTGQSDIAPPSVDRVLANTGRPLESTLRQDMEQRFGHDFSKVRVHTDGAAEQSARDVNAIAYTAGHNVVFGADRFVPGAQAGRRLLAHELTHVVQQSGAVEKHSDQSNGQHSTPPIARTLQRQESGADNDQDGDINQDIVPTPANSPAAAVGAGRPAAGGTPSTPTADITLETGNSSASPLNNLVHQQLCVDRHGLGRKRCFSFAATGVQLPQFSTTWLGWNSWVTGAIIEGQIYEPAPVSGATIVSSHTPTVAQGTTWLNYILGSRLGMQDGYSVARHNCRLYSQWEFRDAPSHW